MIAQLDPLYIKCRPLKVISRMISYAFFEGRPLTTKGRWINPLVFSLLSIESRLPVLKKVEKPVFIVGTGRSGTTILGIVLSMHHQVAFLNEPKAMWHTICPDGDIVGNYSNGPASYRLGEEDVTEEVAETARRIYGQYLTVTFSKRVVDKYPELIFRIPFVKSIFPDAKFLFLVRNGWDTCHSIEGWSRKSGTFVKRERIDWWGVNKRKWNLLVDQVASKEPDLEDFIDDLKKITRHTDMAAVEWLLTMREGQRMMDAYPNDMYKVTFEDLTLHTGDTLEGIIRFCELPADKKCIDYGCSVLTPLPQRETIDLHHAVRSPFYQTMQDLGYE